MIIDDLMKQLDHHSHPLAQVSDAEVLTVAVVAAEYFQNHHERALCVMRMGYLSGRLSSSRFNRRLHALLIVCRCRSVTGFRPRRCRKVRGREYCGYCPAKKEKFF